MSNVKQFLFLAALVASAAHAGIAEDAQRVIAHRQAMPPPTTTFAKWEADQWLFGAYSCAHAAHLSVPPALANARLYTAGTNRSSDSPEKTCAALASGPKAQCHGFNSRQPPFAMPSAGMRPNYAFIASARAVPAEGAQVTAGGDCDLVQGYPETRQFFAGPARVHWLSSPQHVQLNTAQGEQTVMSGTLSFVVDGAPNSFPVMALIPN